MISIGTIRPELYARNVRYKKKTWNCVVGFEKTRYKRKFLSTTTSLALDIDLARSSLSCSSKRHNVISHAEVAA